MKSTLFVVLSLLIALTAANAGAAQCKHRIVFLPQSHAPDQMTSAQSTQAQNDMVAASQLKVARYLDRNPNTPVFSEQVGEQDFTMDVVPKESAATLKILFNTIFQNGLPEKPGDLNPLQKQKLIDNGGEFVQLMRGRTAKLHRVIGDKEKSDQIFTPIKDWFKTNPPQNMPYPREIGLLVYGAREKEALNEINAHFKKNPAQKDVVLIYGSNHSFQFYPELFPPECVIIPEEFRVDWKGKHRAGPAGFSENMLQAEDPVRAEGIE